MTSAEDRSRALAVVVAFAAALAVGIVLLAAFDPEVQEINPRELAERSDDARRFFAGDYVFLLVYGVLSPIAIWRFGPVVGGGTRPWWIVLGALILPAAGMVDAIENALFLSATDSPSRDAVDVAHALAIPKFALFGAGTLLSIAALIRAIGVLRRS